MFAKACDLFWGREQGAEQESEEVPTFTLADSSDDDEPEEPRTAPRRPRRKRSEVHGTVPTRSSVRLTSSAAPAPGFMSNIARDERGHAVMVRTDKSDLSVDERYHVVAAVKDGKAAGKKIADVLKELGVGKNQYARYVKQLKEVGHLQSFKKGRVGAKRKVTGDLYEKFREINRKHRGDKTYRELAVLLERHTGVKVHHTTLGRAAKRSGWRLCAKYFSPHLSPELRAERKAWAEQHVDDDWHAHVDIDEKWFYTLTRKRKRKVDPEWAEEGGPGRTPIPYLKSHIPKVMFLSAIGRPNAAHKFDGRLGIWRCSVPDVTKRKSKNRPAGVPIERDVVITAEFFENQMRTQVVPACLQKMRWAKQITIQMDNARPHIGGGLLDKLNAWGATLKPKVAFIMQPSNSPDVNLNDLCFFSSLASAVSKTLTPNKEVLAQVVEKTYRSWHTAKRLDKLWRLKSAVLREIIKAEGGNQYAMPHRIDKYTPERAPRNRPR